MYKSSRQVIIALANLKINDLVYETVVRHFTELPRH